MTDEKLENAGHGESGRPKGGGGIGSVFGLLTVSVVAVFAGFLAMKVIHAGEIAEHNPLSSNSQAHPVQLPSILTTLAGSSHVRVRLDLVVLAKDQQMPSPQLLSELSDDILYYMRTVRPEQLDAPLGFGNLREDLEDIARERSKGSLSGLLFHSFVLD